jgi:hypothetical protein
VERTNRYKIISLLALLPLLTTVAQPDEKTLCPEIKVEAERFSNLEAITGMTPSHSEVGKTCPKTGRSHSEVGILCLKSGARLCTGGRTFPQIQGMFFKLRNDFSQFWGCFSRFWGGKSEK